MQSLCLVIHYWLVKSKQQKEKKVCLIVKNYPLANITDIKANMIENFITIEAVVLKVYQIKLMAISMDFTCTECKSTTTQMMTEGNFSTPNRCRGDTKKNCRSKSFLPHK